MRLVPRLQQTPWRTRPGPGDLGAGACLLVGGAWFWGLWLESPGVLGSDAWALVCGAVFSGGQGCFQRWLWTHGVLTQPACWWVGLSVSSLLLGLKHLALAPIDIRARAGLGPGANKLEGGF